MKTTDYFKSTTFFYNNIVLKKIIEHKLSLDEFILLIYFINFHISDLDIKKASQITYLDESKILNAYNGLIEKKIISLNVLTNEEGKIVEKISLDNFISEIDSDVLSRNQSNEFDLVKNKFKTYVNRDLSNEECVIIESWLENGYTFKQIDSAFEEANYNGTFSLRYIDKYLNENFKEKYTNKPQQIESTNWLDD